MLEAVIYDMDGVIIDSEPLWKIAEKKTFKKVGIDMTADMCNLTMGYRTDEVVGFWYERFPWTNMDLKEVENDMIDNVMELVTGKGKPMPGLLQSLEFFKEKNIRIGLASSSMMRLIRHTLKTLEIEAYFEVVHSAEYEPYGKPHPAVYLGAAEMLGIPAFHCLAIEDSLNGLIAAKAARMKTIAIPDPSYNNLEKFVIADTRLNSLEELSQSHWNYLNQL